LRDGLGRSVRVRAAELGVNPRDVIEQLVRDAPWSAIAGTPADHPELPFEPTDPAQRDDDSVRVAVARASATVRAAESADQQAGAPETPRRKGGRTRTAKAGEAGKSGQRRGRAPNGTEAGAPRSAGDDPAALSPGPDGAAAVVSAAAPKGCPECGGNGEERADHQAFVCGDCGHTWPA
jgi:hypothetical protein